MFTESELDDVLVFVENIAKEAAALLKSMQGHQTLVKQKDIVDLSTSADLASEKLITEAILKKFPDHDIFAEEAGDLHKQSDYTWIIDPLDGTKEYSRGSDNYNVLIALEYKGDLIAGVAHRVVNGDTYVSGKNRGGFLNGKKIIPSKNSDEKTAVIGFRLPHRNLGTDQINKDLTILKLFINHFYRVRSISDDAHSLAMVANGHFDAHVLDTGICDWYDVAPTILLVEEVGGKVTDFYGNPIRDRDLSKGLVASNGILHDRVIELIASGMTES